jgi:peptidoglycan/LPS O-acetylase OafA/YrhL
VSKELSGYLDSCRFFAAIAVILSHISQKIISGGFLWQLKSYGADAVVIFFVISGFVISYVVSEREKDVKNYAISRLTRIYSVVIPSIVLILIFDAVSLRLDPTAGLLPSMSKAAVWISVPATLFFVNQAWDARHYIGSAEAFWSLSYEVGYYVAFGGMVFAKGRWKVVIPILVLLILGPDGAVASSIWLFGAVLYRLTRIVPQGRWGRILFLFGVLSSVILIIFPSEFAYFRIFDMHYVPGLAESYFVAICFGSTILGIAVDPGFVYSILNWTKIPSHRLASVAAWLANGTFTLYLTHQATMLLVAMLIGALRFRPVGAVIVLCGSVMIPYVVAEFTERRKYLWRPMFTRLVYAVSGSNWGEAGS